MFFNFNGMLFIVILSLFVTFLAATNHVDELQQQTNEMLQDLRIRMKQLSNVQKKLRGSDSTLSKTRQIGLAKKLMVFYFILIT